MRLLSIAAVAALVTLLAPAAAQARRGPVTAYDFSGTWYEVARFPERIGKDCYRNQSFNSPKDEKTLVLNTVCWKGGPNGTESRHKLTAAVSPGDGGTTLTFTYLVFSRDAALLELAGDHSYAVIGSPDRQHVFIISKSPTLPEENYKAIGSRLAAAGYDVSRLIRTPQESALTGVATAN